MRSKRSGMIWMEVLVSVGALAFLSLLGMRSLNLFLERLMTRQAIEIEIMEILGLGERLQKIYDQRRDDSFVLLPGVQRGGESTDENLSLKQMELRTISPSGKLAIWELRDAGGRWTEYLKEGELAESPGRNFTYRGKVVIYPESGPDGGFPKSEHWSFPDCRSQRAQEGFVIYRFW